MRRFNLFLIFFLTLLFPAFILSQSQMLIKLEGNMQDTVYLKVIGDKLLINGEDAETSGYKYSVVRSSGNMNDIFRQPAPVSAGPANLGIVTEETRSGLQVIEILPYSPVHFTSLRKGFFITRVDDIEVSTNQQLIDYIRSKKSGDKITLTFHERPKPFMKRDDRSETVLLGSEIPVGSGAQETAQNRKKVELGLSVRDCNGEDCIQVTNVVKVSNAGAAGLKANDKILKLNDVQMNNVAQMQDYLKNYTAPTIQVTFSRAGKQYETTMKMR